MSKAFGSLAVSVVFLCGVVVSPCEAQEPKPASPVESSQQSPVAALVTPQDAQDAVADYLMEASPLPPNIEIRRHVVGAGADGGESAAVTTLVYSNTLGSFILGVAGIAIADDITTTVEARCPLDRYEFLVSGDLEGDGTGVGPFGVDFGLFDSCPGTGGELIPGTDGHADLSDAGFHMISFQVPGGVDVPLPSTFYLQVEFSRERCGIVAGAPATVGFSADLLHVHGYSCVGNFGGYESLSLWRIPHASFYLDLYVRGECARKFPAYLNRNRSGDRFSPGANTYFADDLKLAVDGCDMTAYEVGIKGEGTISFDLRTAPTDTDPSEGEAIPGTYVSYLGMGPDPQIVRIELDSPVAIPRDLWLVFRPIASEVGPIVTARRAALGESADTYAYYDFRFEQWVYDDLPRPFGYSAFDVTIECAGEPSVGACCDTINRDDRGEAICRELPEMNCPNNRWLEGSACDPDPFTPACGLSACCTPEDTCENLTQNECESLAPTDEVILWMRGRFCEDPDYSCPYYACVNRGFGNSCIVPSDRQGCISAFCCMDVCIADPWCCEVAWDEVCVRWADRLCTWRTENDECSTAFSMLVDDYVVTTIKDATEEATDPGVCCHEGYSCPGGVCDFPWWETEGFCYGGVRDGKSCTTSERNWDLANSGPGSPGFGTVWFTFEATDTSAKVHTCKSIHSHGDSLLQVFGSTDPSTPDSACSTLQLLGCSDDEDYCGDGTQSSVCVTGLVEGETYYVMLAAKTTEDMGVFRLDVESPCTPATVGPSNDYCQQAEPIQLGETPFDLTGATFHCPGDDCLGDTLINDLWYDWTAPADGVCRITTCDPTQPSSAQPNTTLVVYAVDDCPPQAEDVVGCSLVTLGDCGLSSTADVSVMAGQSLKIRLGGFLGGEPSGSLTLTLEDPCPSGPIDWIEPPDGVVDARQPFDPVDVDTPQGIDSLVIRGPDNPRFDLPSCLDRWTVCETAIEEFPNSVTGVLDNHDGMFTVKLARRISAGAVTKVTYTDSSGAENSAFFALLPADVDADRTSNAGDILAIIDIMNGTLLAPWDHYSCDTDHSGACNGADILRVIDMLNGATGTTAWLGRTVPGSCP